MSKRTRRFLKTYILVLLIMMGIGFVAVWIVAGKVAGLAAGREEIASPKAAFDEFVSQADSESLAEIWMDSHPETLETKDRVLTAVEGIINGREYDLRKSVDYSADSPAYVIYAGDISLVKVILEKDARDEWQVADADVQLDCGISKTVYAPVGSCVKCNGIQLDDSYVSEKDVDKLFLPSCSKYLHNPIRWNAWTVSGLLSEPELEVISGDGSELTEKDGVYYCVAPEGLKDELNEVTGEFFSRILYYFMTGKGNWTYNYKQVMNWVIEDSQAAEELKGSIKAVMSSMGDSIYDYEYDTETLVMKKWADNSFSVDLKYTVLVKGSVYQEGVYHVLLSDVGKGYLVCGFSMS